MTDSPISELMTALPYAIRRCIQIDHRIVAAARTLADQGHDLETVAKRIATDLDHRSRAEVGRIARYRILRDAGMLDNEQEN